MSFTNIDIWTNLQNISHYNDGTQVVAVAARDIREGEEVKHHHHQQHHQNNCHHQQHNQNNCHHHQHHQNNCHHQKHDDDDFKKVCDNYFPSSLVMSREERRDWLESHYWYHCQVAKKDEDSVKSS